MEATQFIKARRAGKVLSGQNKPKQLREPITSFQKIAGGEAEAERDRRHAILRQEGFPNQAQLTPDMSDEETEIATRKRN